MEEMFMESLKSFSIQDDLDDSVQDRATNTFRVGSGTPGPLGTSSRSQPSLVQQDLDKTEVTVLPADRSESAKFSFSFNRPNPARLGTARATKSLSSARFGGRQSQENGDGDSSGLTLVTPFTEIPDDSNEWISELEEIPEEALAAAAAPSYEMLNMASLKELDDELLQNKPFTEVNGVDLRKLCKFLVPEKDLVEVDEPWTWDSLYTDIISSPELKHLTRFQNEGSQD